MWLSQEFFVKAGDLLRAGPWNLAGKAIRAMRLISGWGVNLRETPNGTFINFRAPAQIFDHPFRTSLSGGGFDVKWGQVNGVEGTIQKQPILTDDKATAFFALKDGQFKINADKRGWAAIEVTLSKEFKVLKWEIVQVSNLTSDSGEGDDPDADADGGVPLLSGNRARWPIAMFVLGTNGIRAHQIVFFHLSHRFKTFASEPGVKAISGRNFFFPRG